MIKKTLPVVAIALTTFSCPIVAWAQAAVVDPQGEFRFELESAESHRGRAVEGFLYNGLPWRITNVRLRVDSVDANGAVTASSSGWVMGDVKAGGRGYFYVPISTPAAKYRPSVQSFDKVMLEAAPLQAP